MKVAYLLPLYGSQTAGIASFYDRSMRRPYYYLTALYNLHIIVNVRCLKILKRVKNWKLRKARSISKRSRLFLYWTRLIKKRTSMKRNDNK